MNAAVLQQTRLLNPGLRTLPPGVERYRLKGGGSIVLTLAPGDELKIVDPEGRQPCEVAAFNADGINTPESLGGASPAVIGDLSGLSPENNPDAGATIARLREKRIDPAAAKAVHPFPPDSPPGISASFTAQDAVICIVAAPGGPMRVDRQDPPTDLTVFIHRARPDGPSLVELPPPLADPRVDHRIPRRTAHVYEVKAGEYIQIIDVEGRECSDFQCFDTPKLEQGIERPLDATVTRHLMGAAYPAPGLYAKFYDQDMEPVVEVIHDTCGRHDSFGTACTAKYYDDLGYPGHVNCSENFNKLLTPYGVAPRPGWMAINFFFNTNIDDANQMYFEEPWSRPGDYVLVRALKDMVCVSSACPCDVDPANGWNPTDIHLRVYPAKNIFKRAVAYRMTTDADTDLTKETGFHPRTSEHTRNFTEYNGYWLANSYTRYGARDEYWACREGAVVIDLSPLRKYEVLGPDAELLMQTCVTRNVRRLSTGQVVYTAMCHATGGMIDDGTVYRLGDNNFRWIGGTDSSGIWLREQAQKRGLHAWVKNSTEQLHNLQVQGPKSRDIVREIIWTRPDQPTVDELQWFRFSIARIGGERGVPIILSRTGYTGELGFEIFCHPRDAVTVWDALWEAGTPHDLTPLGLEALDVLRIEAGLLFAGYEFNDQTDPFEAGIPFTVPLKSKEDDFIGRDALIRRKANPQRVLVGLELAGDEPGANADPVLVGRQQVGEITSAARSPILRKNVALCRMAVEYAEIGTEVEVGKLDGHQKRLPATVVRFPFYDPDKTRVRG